MDISVYVIGRNCRGTLAQALHSIYAQALKADEVVYLDDGSTDGSAEVASAFVERGLTVLRNVTSQGIPAARNRAARACRGRWIAVLDADDLWHPTKLAAQMAYLDARPEVGLLGTFARVIDFAGEALGTIVAPVSDAQIKHSELLRNCFVHSSVVFRRELFEAVGGYADLPAAQDYDLMLRISEVAPVANLPQPLIDYRIAPGSISVKKRRIQRACTRQARLAAYQRRKRKPSLTARIAGIGHSTFLTLVLFDPRIHWGAHQLLGGESARGRDLLRIARRAGFRGFLVSSLLLMIPDVVYRALGGTGRRLMPLDSP